VQAEGLTPSKLAAVLEEKLKEYMPSGQVSVIVTEVHSFKVSVIGKVQRPDRYRLRSPTTVLDALAMAGGLQEYADGDKIVVLRPQTFVSGRYQTGKTFRRIPFNYKKVITVGGETENFAVQPDDIIVVP
jgi:polysaccharide export outer membrane protein